MRAVEVRVRGRVQGVFFRASARDEACRLGLTGWVRNEPDGSVLLRAAGAGDAGDADDAVAALIDWCRHGPPQARVTAVHVDELEAGAAAPLAAPGGFEIR